MYCFSWLGYSGRGTAEARNNNAADKTEREGRSEGQGSEQANLIHSHKLFSIFTNRYLTLGCSAHSIRICLNKKWKLFWVSIDRLDQYLKKIGFKIYLAFFCLVVKKVQPASLLV